ncbi:6242_t:CDS:2 [Cetraspora pellucida]|uniref:6242_t:CDS:1 n=1 Tax=Cetraspora pellucida TaxID=1433469 RepID=A0A9N9FPR6_9GLOM|nr:6242_t:CDS:2 [Cetraspora pellucida]
MDIDDSTDDEMNDFEESEDDSYDPGYSHNYHLGVGEAWWDLTKKEEYRIKKRECMYLLENILAEPKREEPYNRLDENLQRPPRNEDRWTMKEAYMVDDCFEIENGWYEEEEVEVFLATIWNELELDEKLNDEEPVPNHIPGNEPFDLYDDKRYIGEPYEKEDIPADAPTDACSCGMMTTKMSH